MQVFYIICTFGVSYDSVGFWTIIGFLLFTLISYVSYSGMVKSLELGVGYEYYLDFFCVNIAVQFLTVFSSYFWLIYLAVPGYLGYQLLKLLLAWAETSGTGNEEEPPKKQKERKEKVRYIKR